MESVREVTPSQPGTRLVIVRGATKARAAAVGERVVSFESMRAQPLLRVLLRQRSVTLYTYRADTITRPFLTELWLRLQSRGPCRIEDEGGASIGVTWSRLVRSGWRAACDFASRSSLRRQVDRELRELEARESARGDEPHETPGRRAERRPPSLQAGARPVYLRTDPWFGVAAGGSVGHIAGVLNQLAELGPPPLFITTDDMPTIASAVRVHRVLAPARFRDLPGLLSLAYDRAIEAEAAPLLAADPPAFVYARYALNSYAGLRLARRLGVPFVLEYNGSEVWIQRHWGSGLPEETLARRIEHLNLSGADHVVVVSRALRDELVRAGFSEAKIIVNPNGVDVTRYHPRLDGEPVRRRLALGHRLVIGFIGTFGPWHGAEVLAEAFGRLLSAYPHYRESVRLLWIGDGAGRPAAEQCLARLGVGDASVFAGRVPQAEAPAFLAATDILVSPHVPNPDGSEFFGSPTKLFEYMAMGRAIIASDLAQIGELLDHGETAWLVPPGDPEALVAGLQVLIDDPTLRARLGAAARRQAEDRHTWREHVRRILERVFAEPREPGTRPVQEHPAPHEC
ncbi:MAG: glycosyltransferase family 4 protein [Planctomycetota bacterium]